MIVKQQLSVQNGYNFTGIFQNMYDCSTKMVLTNNFHVEVQNFLNDPHI